MGLLRIAQTLARAELEPFVAPVPDARQVTVWTSQHGATWPISLPAETEPGWWWVRPVSQREGVVDRPAAVHEWFAEYAKRPMLPVVAVWPVSVDTWLCVPFNASDAAQRGWRDAEPRPLHIVRHRLEPFTSVTAWRVCDFLVYDKVWFHVQCAVFRRLAETILLKGDVPFSVQARPAVDLYRSMRDELARQEQQRVIRERMATMEGRIEEAVTFLGGRLVDWREWGESVEVRWEFNGHEHSARVSRSLRLESAGICLAGTDGWQSLSSTVAVIEDARRRGRGMG